MNITSYHSLISRKRANALFSEATKQWFTHFSQMSRYHFADHKMALTQPIVTDRLSS